jgi:hypothetical protein
VNYVNVFVKYGCLAGLAVVLAILITGCSTADSSRQDRPAFITATGVGLTFDEAKENAFKQAIENRVGVLVMSDREIQSYKLVKDEILTISRKIWQKVGCYYAGLGFVEQTYKPNCFFKGVWRQDEWKKSV